MREVSAMQRTDVKVLVRVLWRNRISGKYRYNSARVLIRWLTGSEAGESTKAINVPEDPAGTQPRKVEIAEQEGLGCDRFQGPRSKVKVPEAHCTVTSLGSEEAGN